MEPRPKDRGFLPSRKTAKHSAFGLKSVDSGEGLNRICLSVKKAGQVYISYDNTTPDTVKKQAKKEFLNQACLADLSKFNSAFSDSPFIGIVINIY